MGPRPGVITFLTAAFLSLAWVTAAQAQERITSFAATVEVQPNADIIVNEVIAVVAEGRDIKRGIYRDIPLRYEDKNGVTRSASIDVLNVYRNGQPEQYRVENQGDGIRIYIGNADVFIPRGPHEYEIRYRSGHQLGHFDAFDEIYWNVTGTGWLFPIEQASVQIFIPSGANITSVAAYTGRSGASGSDYTITAQNSDSVTLATTRTLRAGEGFTAAVSWPIGFVERPSAADLFWREHMASIAGLIGFAILLAYFTFVWRRVGKDPDGGPIIAEYEPPEGFSPAACRYLMRMGFDNTAFTAAIVSLAVKGALKIREEDDTFTLERADGKPAKSLSAGERVTFVHMLGHSRASLTLENKNHSILGRARKALKQSLTREFERKHFNLNKGYFVPGLGIGVATVLGMGLLAPDPGVGLFMTIWLTFWGGGCYALLTRVGSAWSGVFAARSIGGGLLKGPGAIFITLFAVPFMVGLVFGFSVFFQTMPILSGILTGLVIATCFSFYHWLKAPTLLGRKTLDKIEGFKLYLGVAEKDRMNFHNPPERTPELFEKFLPYALALDVEHEWSEQFDSILAAAALNTEQQYRPRWYVGGRGFRYGGYSSIGSRLSHGLGAAVTTASTAPSNRSSGSGSFGGGSVGGGGGGGGGGGW